MTSNLIAEAIENIRRGKPETLDSYLKTIVKDCSLDKTQTTFYAHLINSDPNGILMLDDFISFVVRHIVNYAIPRSRIEDAKRKDQEEGLDTHILRLQEDARKLFTPLKKTGEGGEMLLFILGEVLLGLPQLFCKMSTKTSGKMHYHGADGIHAGIGSDGKLELYWGESKLHKDFNGGISDCFDSISPLLRKTDNADHEDLLLLQTHLDLYKPEYTTAIKTVLDKDNAGFKDVRYCGLCFVGFDEDLYSKSTTEKLIHSSCENWKASIQRKLNDKKLQDFKMHFFCLPFTSVEEFRKMFLQRLGLSNA